MVPPVRLLRIVRKSPHFPQPLLRESPGAWSVGFAAWAQARVRGVAPGRADRSGKTRRARDYGVPVIGVDEFLDLTGARPART